MNRRSARTTIVGAALVAVATLAALFALTGTDAQASPGDPLTGYGNAGTVTSGAPTGCDPCPTATSELTHSVLESGGGFAIHGYEWADRAAFPSNGDPAPVSTTGAGLAVTDGSATSWNVALTASTGYGVRVLAVGQQHQHVHVRMREQLGPAKAAHRQQRKAVRKIRLLPQALQGTVGMAGQAVQEFADAPRRGAAVLHGLQGGGFLGAVFLAQGLDAGQVRVDVMNEGRGGLPADSVSTS